MNEAFFPSFPVLGKREKLLKVLTVNSRTLAREEREEKSTILLRARAMNTSAGLCITHTFYFLSSLKEFLQRLVSFLSREEVREEMGRREDLWTC